MNRSIAAGSALLILAAGCGTSTTPSNPPNPVGQNIQVSATSNVTSGVAPLTVSFSAVAAGGSGALTYKWDFGDGANDTNLNAQHTYTTNGTFQAVFTAKDPAGHQANAMVTISVGSATMPAINTTADHYSAMAPRTA